MEGIIVIRIMVKDISKISNNKYQMTNKFQTPNPSSQVNNKNELFHTKYYVACATMKVH